MVRCIRVFSKPEERLSYSDAVAKCEDEALGLKYMGTDEETGLGYLYHIDYFEYAITGSSNVVNCHTLEHKNT